MFDLIVHKIFFITYKNITPMLTIWLCYSATHTRFKRPKIVPRLILSFKEKSSKKARKTAIPFTNKRVTMFSKPLKFKFSISFYNFSNYIHGRFFQLFWSSVQRWQKSAVCPPHLLKSRTIIQTGTRWHLKKNV